MTLDEEDKKWIRDTLAEFEENLLDRMRYGLGTGWRRSDLTEEPKFKLKLTTDSALVDYELERDQ